MLGGLGPDKKTSDELNHPCLGTTMEQVKQYCQRSECDNICNPVGWYMELFHTGLCNARETFT